MKFNIPLFTILLAIPAWSAAESIAALDTDEQKMSYAIGLQIGGQIKQQGRPVDVPALSQGITDAVAGKEPRVPMEEMKQIMDREQKKAQAEQAAKGQKNLEAGKAFLDKNKSVKGVKVLSSGLQYIVLTEGKGEHPKATDTVIVDYRGTLIDGTEFDSSYKRGKPATFPVNGVIKGWQEVLPLMRPGAKWKIFVPSDLAYGPRSTGATIGPNETLIFEIELHSIK